MKRIFCLLIVSVIVLGGCANKGSPDGRDYSLNDGRYVVSEEISDTVPYLLFQGGSFTVVKDIAVSYQPGGTVRRDGNTVVLGGKFADEDFVYSFTLTADDTLRFDLGKSNVPQSRSVWTDGMIFTKSDDSFTYPDTFKSSAE